jgi:hypothetical protein
VKNPWENRCWPDPLQDGHLTMSATEAALGRDHGFTLMGLGPRILRTETAGIVAVALILFLAGEMGRAGGEQVPLT